MKNKVINISSHPKFKRSEYDHHCTKWYTDYLATCSEEERQKNIEWGIQFMKSLNGKTIQEWGEEMKAKLNLSPNNY